MREPVEKTVKTYITSTGEVPQDRLITSGFTHIDAGVDADNFQLQDSLVELDTQLQVYGIELELIKRGDLYVRPVKIVK